MKIKVERINYHYNHKLPQQIQVLNNVNCEISSGEFIGIIGATGSGKTTLLQHFTGLLKPTSGKIFVDDRDIWEKGYPLDELRKKIGLVFQFPESQLFEETVFADVAFGPKALRLSEDDINDRVLQALTLVGMNAEKIRDRSPHQLSDGEMRRVALAGVLAMAPEMLILDEPTAGLDPVGVKLISQILRRLYAEGTTLVLISHNMDLIFELTERIIILDKGSIVFDDYKKNIFTHKHQLEKTKLAMPRIIRLSYYLYERNIIPDWEIYSLRELEKSLGKMETENKQTD